MKARAQQLFGPARHNRARLAASLTALATLAGCVSFPRLQANPLPGGGPDAAPASGPYTVASAENPIQIVGLGGEVAQQPDAPVISATAEQIAALMELRDVEAALPPQPVAQFIDTAFGQVLQVPYALGPGVAQRRELIAVRGPSTMSNRAFFGMVQMALQQYGLAVVVEGGGVRVIQDSVLSGQAPSFIRARATTNAPQSSRPVMQFFPLSSVEVEALMPLLSQAYPNRGSVSFTAQAQDNTLLISGSARDVAAAASVVTQLDRPYFAGGQVAQVEPVFLSPEELADSLIQALSVEGYRVSAQIDGGSRSGLSVLALPYAGQIAIFARDPAALDRALHWVSQLDRAAAVGDGENIFVYSVRNTSAADLGALVAQTGAGQPGAQLPPELAVRRVNGVRVGAQADAGAAGGPASYGAITVDTAGNRLLFRGTASEYARLRTLLEQLDTPPAQVLIELTIAEVTLTDDTRFGVEWFLEQTITDGDLTVNTRGGSLRQPGGLGAVATHVFSRGTVEAAFNAFASNRNLNILSTPRLVTLSGRTAEILIGTDVPIITSQRASDSQSGGDTDILQTVQYRQTGVILNVRPVVYGDGRVDIELYQEVSNQQSNNSSAIDSPLILNRSVSTQLSLEEGMTAVIGGLIQDNYTREQRGVPGLKDIPFLGAAFRSEEISGDKVELVILVTPYIIRDGEDMTALADAMAGQVNRTLRRRGPQVYTLYPWRLPFGDAREHGLGSLEVGVGSSAVAPNASAVTPPPAADEPEH